MYKYKWLTCTNKNDHTHFTNWSNLFSYTFTDRFTKCIHLKVNKKCAHNSFDYVIFINVILHCYKYFTLIDKLILPTWLLLVARYNAMPMYFPLNYQLYSIPPAPPFNEYVFNPPDSPLMPLINSISSFQKLCVYCCIFPEMAGICIRGDGW